MQEATTDKLKLGKGSAFVKSKLRRLPQFDDIWEADFKPHEHGVTWLGITCQPGRCNTVIDSSGGATACPRPPGWRCRCSDRDRGR